MYKWIYGIYGIYGIYEIYVITVDIWIMEYNVYVYNRIYEI